MSREYKATMFTIETKLQAYFDDSFILHYPQVMVTEISSNQRMTQSEVVNHTATHKYIYYVPKLMQHAYTNCPGRRVYETALKIAWFSTSINRSHQKRERERLNHKEETCVSVYLWLWKGYTCAYILNQPHMSTKLLVNNCQTELQEQKISTRLFSN